jgi:hypothetical protein
MDLIDGGHARPRAGIARHVGAKLSEARQTALFSSARN